jgi:hypothetical protein
MGSNRARKKAAKCPGSEDDPDQLVKELQSTVDTANTLEIGQGEQFVYARMATGVRRIG